jgi:hypothetical protein
MLTNRYRLHYRVLLQEVILLLHCEMPLILLDGRFCANSRAFCRCLIGIVHSVDTLSLTPFKMVFFVFCYKLILQLSFAFNGVELLAR